MIDTHATLPAPSIPGPRKARGTMKAAVFVEPGKIVLQEKPIPAIGPTDALMRVLKVAIVP